MRIAINLAPFTFIPSFMGSETGIAAAQLSRKLALNRYQLLIQAGIAGAYDRELALGEVVQVVKDTFIDLGVEEKNADFTSVFELDLIPKDAYPFEQGWIPIEQGELPTFLPKVTGGTVNRVHGTENSIAHTLKKYPGLQVESMEGAAAAYTAKLFQLPFLQVRAISNYVEPRDRAGWKVELAIENLNNTLQEMIIALTSED